VPIPKTVIEETTYSLTTKENEFGELEEVKEVVQERNTGERALVRIRIPLTKVEYEEELGEIKQKIEKMVEIDYDDKALAVAARLDAVPYSIFVINQAAPR
jgi:hypothetical protein